MDDHSASRESEARSYPKCLGKGKFLQEAWAATSTVIQGSVIKAENGSKTEDLDFGPLRELAHSDAVVMMAAFGIRLTEKAAAKLHPEAHKKAYSVLQRVKRTSESISNSYSSFDAATMAHYFSCSIFAHPLQTYASLRRAQKAAQGGGANHSSPRLPTASNSSTPFVLVNDDDDGVCSGALPPADKDVVSTQDNGAAPAPVPTRRSNRRAGQPSSSSSCVAPMKDNDEDEHGDYDDEFSAINRFVRRCEHLRAPPRTTAADQNYLQGDGPLSQAFHHLPLHGDEAACGLLLESLVVMRELKRIRKADGRKFSGAEKKGEEDKPALSEAYTHFYLEKRDERSESAAQSSGAPQTNGGSFRYAFPNELNR